MLTVSVVIPTFNRRGLVERAIRSALSQVRPGDEVIVVDDGSTDGTADALSVFGNRIRTVHTENRGGGPARNRGVAESHGDLIAFLDSDDEWMPHKLALHRALFEARPDIVFAFSDMATTDPSGVPRSRQLIQWHRDNRSWDEIVAPGVLFSKLSERPDGVEDFSVHIGSCYALLANALYVCNSTAVVCRANAGDALQFDDLPIYEELGCFAKMARRGPAAFLDLDTAWQHGDSEGRISDATALMRADARLTLLHRIWGSDAQYMARHASHHRSLVDRERRIRVATLLDTGRRVEAREELSRMERAPYRLRLLAALPGMLLRQLLRLRQWMKG